MLRVLLFSVSILLHSPALAGDSQYTKSAVLQGLNKITARANPLSVETGQIVNFGNIEVKLHKCWTAPPEEEPENKALLSIWEQIPGEDKTLIFNGWMFASTPGISSLEHPIYDITLLECK